jgi:4-hydroxy-2-oxoheptanedioate aldolase
MKINTAKQKLLGGKPAFGYELVLGSPLVAETVAGGGIDFVQIDTQHGSWGPESTIATLAAIADTPATPFARVASNNFTMIGRLLDEGVLGIVVPMVDTVADARAAAAACRFPPNGGRSWGWGRARAFGADYPEWIDEQIFVAVQIESALAVENVEAILAVPGIDGC